MRELDWHQRKGDAGFLEWLAPPHLGCVTRRLGVEVDGALALAGMSPPVRRLEIFKRYTLAT
ncbi:hypothetical protein [Myxococcus llanfairpwllgwyngyllgogerychwyrndrobwllllantysiliogogogochensis]|uniref:hypothetical protein n=1 Tax=Myxococcus llanfairpwllgwyngyllgogerychwyrndrobwllllantysiliogogogochensis TaxID=2590453 RepID=UPI0015F0E131|nr:hypothetical protein [Myxococcus llanfairpwllgwyngyllgogerychwyrndrobwllllantysiliogogogochensis]